MPIVYRFWESGNEVGNSRCKLPDAKKSARERAGVSGKYVFICKGKDVKETFPNNRSYLLPETVVTAFVIRDGKVREAKESREELWKMLCEEIHVNRRGGKPKLSEVKSATLAFSVSVEDREEYLEYAERFSNGNQSELFRRIFKYWKNAMKEVVGE